jgi:hypothetical protein
MRRARALTVLLAAAGLCACASLSEKQCRSGDWTSIGRDDGAHGLAANEFDKHREACKPYGKEPDAKAYEAGRAQGLKTYCTQAGAYVSARRGLGYNGVCANRSEGLFLEAFRAGQHVNTQMREVRDLRRDIDELQIAAMSEDHSDAERTQMRFRAQDLNQRLRIREWDLERADRNYAAKFGAPELTWIEVRELNP